VYGLDISTSAPIRSGVTLGFEFARYFSAPALARTVYRNDAAFERALAVGRLVPESQIELLPAADPQLDNVTATIPTSGSYLVAAPQ
jgi:hypothetical protein